ncbi:MAG: thioredoxin [Oscillospiraceae bacterium]|nr:thioredoxin [Oscillospiraceae bacterium]
MKRAYFGIAAGVIGLVLIAYGVLSGQAGLVLQKAIRVCLECVGLG